MAHYDEYKDRMGFIIDLLDPAVPERFFEHGTKFVVARIQQSGHEKEVVWSVWCRETHSWESPLYLDHGLKPHLECTHWTEMRDGRDVLFIQLRRKSASGIREMVRGYIRGGVVDVVTTAGSARSNPKRYAVLGIIPED